MAKFRFRLSVVLAHRARLEADARRKLVEKHAEVLGAEGELVALAQTRSRTLSEARTTLAEYQLLERELAAIDDAEREVRVVLSVLRDEEMAARAAWLATRKERAAVEKLRDAAFQAWLLDERRLEQKLLDEWAGARPNPARSAA